jgi:O-antigen ligase
VAIPEARSTARATGRKSVGGFALPFWPPPRDGWIAIAGVALIYAAHWFYGALISDTAMVMNIVAALLVGGILLSPRLRDDVLRLKGLAAPAICFALVVAVALWTLTPWTPGGPHPVWAYVGVSPGASTIDKSATLVEIAKLLGLACMFVVGLASGARDDRARYAVRLAIMAGALFGLWALIASATGVTDPHSGRRLQAHFLNPNTAGTVFAMLLLLSVAEAVAACRQEDRRRAPVTATLLAATAPIFLMCLLATASRGAMTAVLVGVVAYLAMQVATGRLKMGKAAIGGLLAAGTLVLLVGLVGDQLIDRLFQSHAASIGRAQIWAIHWKAFLDSPVFGYGLGAAETVNKTLISPSNYPSLWSIRAILNVYLQWLEEAGIVGAAPMFLCIGWLIVSTARGTLRRSRMAGLLCALLAVDSAVLVHGATDFGLEVSSVAAFWAWALGLQFSLSQGSSRR